MPIRVRELTPQGVGAVSVLEVTGDGALDAVRRLASSASLESGTLRVLRLSDGEEDLDEAIVLASDADRVELHLHGSPVLVERIAQLLAGGQLQGEEGFSLEEEALELLAQARGEVAARILLDQAEGALTRRLEELLTMEESAARAALATLLADSQRLAPMLDPPRVVLAGPTNSGKSTLFNVLVGSERAITSAEEGTTRDLLIGFADLDGIVFELVDTAGERELLTDDGSAGVERAGQSAARALCQRADHVLWLERVGAPSTSCPPGFDRLKTHADLLADPPDGAISALSDPQGARSAVSGLLRRDLSLHDHQWRQGEPVLFSASLRARVMEILELSEGFSVELLRALLAR